MSGVESGAGAPLTAATAQGSASTRRTSAPPPAARHLGQSRPTFAAAAPTTVARGLGVGEGASTMDARAPTIDCHALSLAAHPRVLQEGGIVRGPAGSTSRRKMACWLRPRAPEPLSECAQDLRGHKVVSCWTSKIPNRKSRPVSVASDLVCRGKLVRCSQSTASVQSSQVTYGHDSPPLAAQSWAICSLAHRCCSSASSCHPHFEATTARGASWSAERLWAWAQPPAALSLLWTAPQLSMEHNAIGPDRVRGSESGSQRLFCGPRFFTSRPAEVIKNQPGCHAAVLHVLLLRGNSVQRHARAVVDRSAPPSLPWPPR